MRVQTRLVRLLTASFGFAALVAGSMIAGAGATGASPSLARSPAAVVVSTANSPDGRVLTTGNGLGLYLFSGDAFPFSKTAPFQLPCTALNVAPPPVGVPCTTAWPPLLATGPLVAENGVQQLGLGKVTRNGMRQVTYYGHPLYGFIRDSAATPITGQNAAAFDGIFHLVSPSGRPDAGMGRVTTQVSANGIVLSTPTATGARTLYRLTYDPRNATACNGACTAVWPPLLTTRNPQAGPGAAHQKLGTIRRPDGTFQITYNNHPLYLFAFDLGAGAPTGLTLGENFADSDAFGLWYTLSPTGLSNPGTATVGSEAATGGQILSVISGFTHAPVTLYAFSADSATTSACLDSCARFWPPVLTTGPPLATHGINAAHLGAIQRPSGAFQVTYFGHPLYYFSHDLTSGTSGAGTSAFGGSFQTIRTSGTVG